MTKPTDHIIIDGSKEPTVIRCKNCGDSQSLPLPIRLELLPILLDGYLKKHIDCQKMEVTA